MLASIKRMTHDVLPGPVVDQLFLLKTRMGLSSADRSQNHRLAIHHRLGRPTEVMQGPFAGLRFGVRHRENWLKYLLGTYEREIWPAVEALISAEPDVVVNIGAAGGYYSTGLAKRLSDSRIVAFEGVAYQRYLVRRMARQNGVADRVTVRRWCTVPRLHEALEEAHRPAVFCDCEGGEAELLDPQRAPALRKAWIIVELHDHLVPGVSDQIAARFAATHERQIYQVGERSPADLPAECSLDERDAAFAMEEQRQCPSTPVWLLRPKEDGDG